MEWIKRKLPLILLIGLIVWIIWFLWLLSWLWQSSQSQSWDELEQERVRMKCEAKKKKQRYIDTANFKDSLRIKTNRQVENSWYLYGWNWIFVWPDQLNLELAKINLILSWDTVDCTGISYDKINLKDIIWSIVTKVHATDYSESTKDKRKWRVIHKWYPKDSIVQLYVNYAYRVSWWDLDFLATLDAENWRRDPHRQSQVPDSRWPNWREDSYWFCMLHRKWHKDIVDDPRFRNDNFRQISQCRYKYHNWTKFYWYYQRWKTINRFEVIKPLHHKK